MKMRVLFTAAVSLLALAACGNPAPAAPTAEEIAKASADINAWFDAEYEEELQMSPIGLTFQGRKDQYDKLDDYSEAAIDREAGMAPGQRRRDEREVRSPSEAERGGQDVVRPLGAVARHGQRRPRSSAARRTSS
jgi:hypothetical protein